MKILVLGSSGFLGSYLGFALPKMGHEVSGVSRNPVAYFPANQVKEELDDYTEIIRSGDYQLVINCVAVASHEACESDPEMAETVNARFPGIWASVAAEAGASFVHFSSDAVFDGSRAELYSESDETAPESAYGRTKVQGEQAVLAANPDALVLRVNFFGWSRSKNSGILDFFVNAFTHHTSITGFQDYVVSSLYMGDLAEAMMELVERGASGVFHAVSSTPLSKYDFGLTVASADGLPADSMAAGSLAGATGLAPRGQNLSLSTAKIEKVVGRAMPTSEVGVQRALAERKALMDYFGVSEE
ncbi:SDR family oxidoreductase [Pontimonas sp.]|nr:SDR family oxidoreductase [Pontimonas sp.]MDA8863210.1 SDR family oxidoreductase [Pontimonas sp.]